MVDPIPVALGGVAVIIALWYGIRAYSSLQRYRSVAAEADSTTPIGGEPITIEGTATVDEPAPATDHVEPLVEDAGPFALIDWRVQSPQGKNRYGIDLEERTIKRKRATIEAGVEAAPFTVDAQGTTYQVDTDALVERADGPSLATLDTLGGANAASPLFGSDWATRTLYLDDSTVDKPLDDVPFLADAVNDTQASRYRFGARAVPDGTTVAVHGEVTIDDGVPTVRETAETALLVSDQGIDGLTAGVRNTLLKQSVGAAGALAVGGYLIYAGIWTVPI